MSYWIDLPRSDKLLKDLKERNGYRIRLLVSPYDVPDAIRGSYDDTKERFVVEFKYVADEDTKLIEQDKYVALRTGVNSERLYGIEIDVKALKAKSVRLEFAVKKEVSNALEALVNEPDRSFRRNNYELARAAVEDTDDRLFAALAAA